jgi:GNAT superfamily N-acetyltransferase
MSTLPPTPSTQQLRQLGDIRRDPPRLIAAIAGGSDCNSNVKTPICDLCHFAGARTDVTNGHRNHSASRASGASMFQLSMTGKHPAGALILTNQGHRASLEKQDFDLRKVVDLNILEKIYALRVNAWRTNMNIPAWAKAWKDSFDNDAQHWAIMSGNVPIAAARITVHNYPDEVPDAEIYNGLIANVPSPICSFNRLVVHPDFRGLGLSRLLDEVRLATAKSLGCRTAILTVSDARRARAIEAHGFTHVGDGIPYSDGMLKGRRNIVFVLLF